MSDLGTMEQDIYETLQSLTSKTKIRHRIISSIDFHRENRYFFSERTFRFPLTAGRGEYRPGDGFGMPADLVMIQGSYLWLTPRGDTQAMPIERSTRDALDWDRVFESGQTGEPEMWDWFADALRLSPLPDDADTIEGPYLRDIGVPLKKYDVAGSTWNFFTPDGATALTGDFTNHWFDPKGGYALVKHRALHLCYKELLQDSDRSNEEMGTWLEEKARLEEHTDAKIGPLAIEPAFW